MTTEYTYDNLNRVQTIQTKKGSSTISSLSYTFDDNGNIASETLDGQTTTYTYDSQNRLKSYTAAGVTTTYEYDSRGNRLKETRGSQVTEYAYNDRGQLVSRSVDGAVTDTYTYNAQGALTGRNSETFSYNEWDRMISSTDADGTQTSYRYDSDNLRTQKGDTTYQVGLDGTVLQEQSGGDTVQMVYGHRPLARKVDGVWYYYVYNAHGDILSLVNEAGTPVNTYQYDPWGVILSETETVENPIKYAGEYYDEETGFIYLRQRYYDPQVGRFISEDTVKDGQNWYLYTNNNPIMYIDPTGLDALAVPGGIVEGFFTGSFELSPAGILIPIFIWIFKPLEAGETEEDLAELKKSARPIGPQPPEPEPPNKFEKAMAALSAAATTIQSYIDQYGIKAYRIMTNYTGKGTGLEAHHIIPQRFAKAIGMNVGDMKSIVLPKEIHQLFTNAWHAAIPVGTELTTLEQIKICITQH